MVLVFFGAGFEEVEALTPVDVLRRAGIDVKMVGVDGDSIEGGHGICIEMNQKIDAIGVLEDVEMIILPGGVPGIDNLMKSEKLKGLVAEALDKNIYVAAICAAPTVLEAWGLIKGRQITVYPSHASSIVTAHLLDEDVVVDGNLITGRGVGVATAFSLELVKQLKGADVANNLGRKMVVPE